MLNKLVKPTINDLPDGMAIGVNAHVSPASVKPGKLLHWIFIITIFHFSNVTIWKGGTFFFLSFWMGDISVFCFFMCSAYTVESAHAVLISFCFNLKELFHVMDSYVTNL